MTDDLNEQLVSLLIRSGHTPEEARAAAEETLHHLASVGVGSTWGGMHAEFLPRLWAQATQSGHQRKLLLEITCEGDEYGEYFGHIRVEVKAAQSWTEYEQAWREGSEREAN
jgi:cytosine/adenosine deaminase-related metal-dependent hydrolase